ncbi:hypothetical protein [Streptomyces sp. NPDC015131]|uniref:SGM_3592 family protein n=1 Tax=Streptomyces sp. NPDC015131 TaxID=3364941 RepID=UPI0036FDB177
MAADHGHRDGDAGRDGEDAPDAPGTAPRRNGWDDVELDHDFIRSAGTTEPSARARMLAARWRGRPPEPEPWRSDEPPAGWFFSRAGRAGRAGRARRADRARRGGGLFGWRRRRGDGRD